MRQRGFSVVEVIITIVVLGILLLLAVTTFSSSQIASRDNARQQSAESIARGLEQYYRSGNPTLSIPAGRYPSLAELNHARGQSVSSITPNQVSGGYISTWLNGTSNTAAGQIRPITDYTSSVDTTSGFTSTFGLDVYAYEPLRYNPNTPAWETCTAVTDACLRFNLYYRAEVDNSIKTVRSQHQ